MFYFHDECQIDRTVKLDLDRNVKLGLDHLPL